MKVVVLNGSPRREGVVSQMVGHVVRNLPAECRVEAFFVHGLHVKPCTGCMRCRTLGRCVLPEDDGHRVAAQLREADAFVVGSPCYWGGMSGELKVLFDRCVYAMMGERENGMPVPLHKGKRAVLVASCNTIWPFNVLFRQTGGVFRALREILKWSGCKVVGKLAKGGCRKCGELSVKEMRKCRKLAKKIC
ncbi:flavodoxin family protein [Alistipes sp.]|uniref:flavodoxin family protein n=1 Tax=Alistipes sp. TaxID=1872444 RepID=UPI003AF0ED88